MHTRRRVGMRVPVRAAPAAPGSRAALGTRARTHLHDTSRLTQSQTHVSHSAGHKQAGSIKQNTPRTSDKARMVHYEFTDFSFVEKNKTRYYIRGYDRGELTSEHRSRITGTSLTVTASLPMSRAPPGGRTRAGARRAGAADPMVRGRCRTSLGSRRRAPRPSRRSASPETPSP